ncbi:MAG: insulinase family protein [Saprospiraceae bacterium]|nr:MAG: insulinase family protein [Saprospiraceae bacterium]
MKMKSTYSWLLVALVSLFLGNESHAQNAKKESNLPDGIEKATSVEGITEYHLKDNGLKVLLFPDQSKPTITVNVTYLVGSRHEGYGETGMAHLLEHLVFKGTPNHPDIPQELTEHGARPNGSTWFDRTNYFETFNATEENLRWALDMESDRMVNSYIAKKDLESEMTVVRNEFEMGENDPSGILMERVISTAYLWHNYGNSTIGARADIENVPIENLQAFYHKNYQPDNAVLVVAGKIDETQTLAMIDQYFSKIPRPERKLTPTFTKEPTQDGERSVTLRRSGDVQVVSCMYHTPPGPHREYAAISVLDEILTNEPAGRLYKALVESKKASAVWSFAPGLKEGGFIYINAGVRMENSLDEAKATMLQTLDELAANPPTDEEVDRAKKRILKNWELQFRNSASVGLAASEFIAQGDWRLAFLQRDNVENVTPADVLDVIKRYLKPSNRTTGTFIPDKNPDRSDIPDAPNLETLLANYKGKEAIAEGENFDPSCENIESRTTRGTAPDKSIEFALLPKETRGNAVSARMTLRFGDVNSLKGKAIASQFASSMLDKGTATMSRQEIQDELDRLKARVSISGSGATLDVNIEKEHDNLVEVLNLVGSMLKTPAFSQQEFDKLKEEELAGIESQRSDPSALAVNKYRRMLSDYSKDDVRYVMTFEEEAAAIKGLTLDNVKAFYKDFYGTSDATFSAAGDFDAQTVKAAVVNNFSGWESSHGYARIQNKYKEVKPANESINTPDKANAMFIAGMPLEIRDDDPDYPALVMGNFILGGGFLNSRLAVRIRQKEGLSYGVGSQFNASSEDKLGNFTAYAIYAPENVTKLEAAFKEEIQKMLDEGFSGEELEAAKSGYLQGRGMNRSDDRSLSGTLNNYLQLDRNLMWDAKLEKQIMSLTTNQINAAVKKYIDPAKLVIVKAGDYAKVGKP